MTQRLQCAVEVANPFRKLYLERGVDRELVETCGAALAVTVVNIFMGTLIAWVLVRDSFPGKRFLEVLIDLPFALRDQARAARDRWPGAAVVLTPIFWPWAPASLLRGRDPAIWYRAGRNAAKAWVTWRALREAGRTLP